MNGTDGGLPTERPRVLVPEKLSPDGLALLRTTLGVDEKKGLSAVDLESIIGEYDALLIRSETKVTEHLLQAAKKLKVVARAGVGVDNVDVKAATQLGIIVVNSPSGNIGAAAEHTIALLMALARNVPDACSSLKDKKWERSRLVGVEVKGKVLGIIGLGKGKQGSFAMAPHSRHGLSQLILTSRPNCCPSCSWSWNECCSP
jgi:D-3-phosphoglycerate dehydrogenase / 2-oxoglutarate reductase